MLGESEKTKGGCRNADIVGVNIDSGVGGNTRSANKKWDANISFISSIGNSLSESKNRRIDTALFFHEAYGTRLNGNHCPLCR